MKPLGSNLFECVYLAGHPALTTSNSDDPAGSFHSKDVFTPHSSIPQRWKHVSRIDDRITLTNGEKVLPLPIEGCIKQNHLIQEAVVVGLNKSSPGLLVFRSQEADEADLSEEEYFAAIWPTIELANSRAEHFSRIAKDMIAVLPSDSKFPRTDKGSMIREQVNSQYAEVIERIYSGEEKQGGLRVGVDETRSVIMDLCQSELGVPLSGAETSFFSEGMDSLKAIHLRRLILQSFELPKERLPQNVVYDTGSVARLAEHICAAQSGKETPSKDDNEAMLELVQKYSTFSQHTPCGSSPSSNSAVSANSLESIHLLTTRRSSLEQLAQSVRTRYTSF